MNKVNTKSVILFLFLLIFITSCNAGIKFDAAQDSSQEIAADGTSEEIAVTGGSPLEEALEPMKKAALAKDVEGVLGYFEEEARERYRGLFTEMGDELAQVFEEMAPPKLKSIDDNVAIYETIRKENGEYWLYEIRFIKDPETNKWYIDSM